jgi:predicted Rdx family selenoprotein
MMWTDAGSFGLGVVETKIWEFKRDGGILVLTTKKLKYFASGMRRIVFGVIDVDSGVRSITNVYPALFYSHKFDV